MSTNSLTLGSGLSPDGLVRMIDGARCHTTGLRLTSILRSQSTWVQSHLGLVEPPVVELLVISQKQLYLIDNKVHLYTITRHQLVGPLLKVVVFKTLIVGELLILELCSVQFKLTPSRQPFVDDNRKYNHVKIVPVTEFKN